MGRPCTHLLASVGALLWAVGNPVSGFGQPRQTNVSYWYCYDGEFNFTLKITQIGNGNTFVGVGPEVRPEMNIYSGFRGLKGTGDPSSDLTLTLYLKMKRAIKPDLRRDCDSLPWLYDAEEFKVDSSGTGAAGKIYEGEWNMPQYDSKDDGHYECVSHRTEPQVFSMKLAPGGYGGGPPPPPPSASPTPSPTPSDPIAPVKDLWNEWWKIVGDRIENLVP